jgi:hypothetical protein
MKAIVTGMIATYPVGGVAWDYGQYLLGLERLGFDVYYLEDNAIPLCDPKTGIESEYGIYFLKETLAQLSPALSERWHVRNLYGKTFGINPAKMQRIIASADIFINISGCTLLRDEYMANQCKLLIDTDPGKNHFLVFPKYEFDPGVEGTQNWKSHDHFFTYAESIGSSECILPALGIDWLVTRPPVVLEQWKPAIQTHGWTTVMSWKGHGDSFFHDGKEFGGKEMEFNKIKDLPKLFSADFEIALGGFNPPKQYMREHGWSIIDSVNCSRTIETYRDYIQQSRGEFSVAKNVYVATHSGWFSCRSVCYLASSRPVVIQDTGFSDFIPTGEGLFAFNNIDEARLAVEKVEQNYAKHQRAAIDIAHEYFDSDKVIGKILKDVGIAY